MIYFAKGILNTLLKKRFLSEMQEPVPLNLYTGLNEMKFSDGGITMSKKAMQALRIISVAAAVLLIVTIFAACSPYLFSLNIAIPVKMLIEWSPYILMVGIVAGMCKIQKKPLGVGLGFNRVKISRQLVIAALIFAVTITLFTVIPLLLVTDKSNMLGQKPRSLFILVYQIFKLIIFVGLGEEIIWRGYMFEEIKGLTSSGVWTVVISSVLFGIWHYPIGQNILQVLVTAILGLIYGFARLKIRNCTTLSVGIAHGLHDSFIAVLSYMLL